MGSLLEYSSTAFYCKMSMKQVYLGVDVGSVTTKVVVLNEENELLFSTYLRTKGNPIMTIQQGLCELIKDFPGDVEVCGVGTTGSARYPAGVIIGADVVKNEITSQAVGALHYIPNAQTILEIGGQDSKIIIIRDGIVVDFDMNTVCAAGTGSFLDHQALRLNMDIEEFSRRSMLSKSPVRIAGRCTVFAESDMIHKQQMGHPVDDILHGLCQAMVRNYINNVGLGKEILPPVVFQGGVAFNQGILRAFKDELDVDIIVPPHHEVTGAIGVALLVHEEMEARGDESMFRGFDVSMADYHTSSFECNETHQPSRSQQCDRWEKATETEEVKV